jgi:hypothetical protein
MSRVLARLPPEDHQLTGKRSCKRRDSNGRPKCQNMRVSLLSAAFFLYWVLAIRRAARCRSGWGALSSVTSFLRKLQDEVPSQSLRFYLFDEPLRQDPTKIATAERWLGKTILFYTASRSRGDQGESVVDVSRARVKICRKASRPNKHAFSTCGQWCFMFLILFLQKFSADRDVVRPHVPISLSK